MATLLFVKQLPSHGGGGDPVDPGTGYLDVASVSANGAQDPNVAGNVLDGDFGTRWSYDQDPAQLTLDLGATVTVGTVEIAWYSERTFFFDVYTSTDGASWTHVFDGASGGTTAYEVYDFADISARYVRIDGHGNDGTAGQAPWTSITEVRIGEANGTGSAHPTPPAAPATAPVLTAGTPTDTSVPLSWTEVADADWYRIRRDGVTIADDVTSLSYTATGLTASTSYDFDVAGVNVTDVGPWSNVETVVTDATGTVAASWQDAWDTSNRTTVRDWFLANTGCRIAETSLTDSGGFSTSHDGQVIEGLHIFSTGGGIQVRHKNVVIRDCIIETRGKGVFIEWADWDFYFNATIEYCTIKGHPDDPEISGQSSRNGIDWTYGGALTCRYVRVTDRYQGWFLTGDCHLDYCMVDDIHRVGEDHNTGMSTRRGTGTRINRCWIEGNSSSCVSLYPDQSKPAILSDFWVTECVLEQGNYHVHGGGDKKYAGSMTGIRFVNNKHSHVTNFCWKDSGECYGVRAAWVSSGNEWSGNTFWDGTVAE